VRVRWSGGTREHPGAKITVIERAGHFTPLEEPEAVTEALRGPLQIPIKDRFSKSMDRVYVKPRLPPGEFWRYLEKGEEK
jgi:hypothetical protein